MLTCWIPVFLKAYGGITVIFPTGGHWIVRRSVKLENFQEVSVKADKSAPLRSMVVIPSFEAAEPLSPNQPSVQDVNVPTSLIVVTF